MRGWLDENQEGHFKFINFSADFIDSEYSNSSTAVLLQCMKKQTTGVSHLYVYV